MKLNTIHKMLNSLEDVTLTAFNTMTRISILQIKY